jgi:Tfp pilus assembly protein PilO
MTRSPKDKAMLIAMGVLLLFAAYNFLIRPQGAELSSAREERTNVEQKLSDAQAALLAQPDPEQGQSQPDAAALEAAVPAQPAIATLLRQLQAIATETGMSHASISPSAVGANPAGPGGSLQIAIIAFGSHDATLDYVQHLRDLERLVVIEQVAIDVQPDATEQLQISARVFTRGP